MEEPANELLRPGHDQLFLPVMEHDWAKVLRATSVLGEKNRPVLRVRRDVYSAAAGFRRQSNGVVRHHRFDGTPNLTDDGGVGDVEADAEPVAALLAQRKTAVPEIRTEQVGVRCRGDFFRAAVRSPASVFHRHAAGGTRTHTP